MSYASSPQTQARPLNTHAKKLRWDKHQSACVIGSTVCTQILQVYFGISPLKDHLTLPYPALTMLICWFWGKISTSIYKTLGHCVITSCNGKAGLFKEHFVFWWYFFMEVYDSIRKRHICVVSITDNILIL